ncbi:ATP-binding cassette domain-containing protein [Phytomonospora endophytica]|uniref:ATP-binding cassette subfamily C protein n=1 Tax=Phytomonospora endophytica TaxID=714109 RepID=A0A841FK37_9ACTN|nr:ABC transporter ATP-binding protein [Phytomonospora endophytica]MBB6033507.1 ATP-binding cassette subfamily C protein [Phytomonospora endophytica]GIG64976.1 ABC transporter ATP-binding protein [Phytomonospora endophytica]
MRREISYGLRSLRRRPLWMFALWSVPEALPTALSGLAVARAVDDGFLAGRPLVGVAWLASVLVAACAGALGARQVFARLGDLVEPFRDDLVRSTVDGALDRAVRGRSDDGALARLTHQVEIVRDTYAGLLVLVRGFCVTSVGAIAGLASVSPLVLIWTLPPFALGLGLFLATLGLAARRQREYVRSDEDLSTVAGRVLGGARDLAAHGARDWALALAGRSVDAQARAERALARVAALRTLCFAVGGWLPLLALLAAGPWLAARGVTAGAILGGLTYVLIGLQPALGSLVQGLGGSGLRFVVTLGRLLDTAAPPPRPSPASGRPRGGAVSARGLTFAYGPHAEPVLRDLDLDLPAGSHLAVVGPSGIGKSTFASLCAGLLTPGAGTVTVDGSPEPAPDLRVLIPQEAYVFTGTVAENLSYHSADASRARLDRAAEAVGAAGLIARLGGLDAPIRPAGLSAGERQLIALTRAYLSPAPLAILDEATCHLDPAAEERAEKAFAERPGTLIVIAHRISSAERAGTVLVLDGTGAVFGDRATMPERSPMFRELLGHWDAQIQPAS